MNGIERKLLMKLNRKYCEKNLLQVWCVPLLHLTQGPAFSTLTMGEIDEMNDVEWEWFNEIKW